MSLQSAVTAEPLYIDRPETLQELCTHLAQQTWIGVDTEFLREKTYYAQLCLVQVSTQHLLACVDPLAVDINPLLDVLYRPDIVKVMHAARQDLELMTQVREVPPPAVFDTQIAATLLAYGDQIGYAGLVEQVFKVVLDKGQTRTDWSQRPLSPEQLLYAADDVRHLGPLYAHLNEALEQRGRREWLHDEFAALSDPSVYRWDPNTLWQKVSGTQVLRGRQLAVVNALAVWRERKAMTLDRPRRWVVPDPVLVDIARRAPRDAAGLARIRGFDGPLLNHAQEILAVLEQAGQLPREAWPEAPARIRLEAHEEALVDALMAATRSVAAAEELSPAVLTARRELERLVRGDTDLAVLQGWRGALCGDVLQRLMRGAVSLRVEAGRLRLVNA